jgi:hypothetical protein
MLISPSGHSNIALLLMALSLISLVRPTCPLRKATSIDRHPAAEHRNIAFLTLKVRENINGLRNEGGSQISNKVHRFQTAFDNDRGYETQAHAVFYDVYAREEGLGVRMSLLCVGLRLDMRICRC